MTTAPQTPRPRWSLRRKLALQLVLVPALLLLVEGVWQVLEAANGRPHDAAAVLAALERVAERVDEPVGLYAPDDNQDEVEDEDRARIQNPYFAWDFPVAQRSLTKTARYFQRKQGEEAFDVLILGGSVAGGFVRDGGARLQQRLAEDPRIGTRVTRLHGRARGGFKQPQQVNTLTYLLAIGWKPDVVVNIDGFNEVALPAYNATHDAHPIHPSIPHWASLATGASIDRETMDLMLEIRRQQLRARATVDLVRRFGLHHSALLTRVLRSHMLQVRRDYNTAHERFAAAAIDNARDFSQLGPPYEHEFTGVMDAALDAWELSSISLQGVCEAHRIPYLHILQPTLHDPGSKPLTEAEIASGGAHEEWIDAATWCYPKLRERGQGLLARGIAFSDCSMLFEEVSETLYYDACHFSVSGQELFADRIARDVLALLD